MEKSCQESSCCAERCGRRSARPRPSAALEWPILRHRRRFAQHGARHWGAAARRRQLPPSGHRLFASLHPARPCALPATRARSRWDKVTTTRQLCWKWQLSRWQRPAATAQQIPAPVWPRSCHWYDQLRICREGRPRAGPWWRHLWRNAKQSGGHVAGGPGGRSQYCSLRGHKQREPRGTVY